MTIHFIGLLEGNKKDYKQIIQVILSHGWQLVTDHSLVRTVEQVERESLQESESYIKEMQTWIQRADIVIIEATVPVLGTGYELSYAVQKGKPVIVLYRPQRGNTPHVIKGYDPEKIQVLPYTDESLTKTIESAVAYAQEQMDVRFHLLVSPKINAYLMWIAENKNIPRSSLIRSLLEENMKANKEYSSVLNQKK
jgi:hypothetical protein